MSTTIETLPNDTNVRREIKGAAFLIEKLAAGTEIPRHYQNVARISFVLQGGLEEHVETGKVVSYVPFQVWFHPRNEITKTKVKADAIRFTVELDSGGLDRLRRHGVDVSSNFCLKGTQAEEVAKNICRRFDVKGPKGSQMLFEAYTEVLDLILELRQEIKGPIQPWLISAKEIIQETFRDPLPLKEIADRVGIHPVHLAQEFRKTFGITVGNFTKNLRLAEAKHYLINSTTSIAVIANRLGFYDHAHFVKVFRSDAKMTPSSFREKERAAAGLI